MLAYTDTLASLHPSSTDLGSRPRGVYDDPHQTIIRLLELLRNKSVASISVISLVSSIFLIRSLRLIREVVSLMQ